MNFRRYLARPVFVVVTLLAATHTVSSCADGEALFGLPESPDATATATATGGSNSAVSPSSASTTTQGVISSSGAGGDIREPFSSWPDGGESSTRKTEFVLLISVDGLATRFLWQLIEEDRAPAFKRLASIGASTHNARTDTTFTNTLPNHTCMLTGLPVAAALGMPPEQGHGYTFNGDAGTEVTLHNSGNPARAYVPSVFDVAHDHGKRTGMFASKTKFSVYTNSYNTAGAADQTGEDDGNAKIDVVEINTDPEAVSDLAISNLQDNPPNFSFVHFNEPDLTGHSSSWGGEAYLSAVQAVDQQITRILEAVVDNEAMRGRTAVIVTSDHGGTGYSHLDAANKDNFVIPFYVAGPGVPGATNLYALVKDFRAAPIGDVNPGYDAERQPVRNGDAGNLALELLGLPPVPGSLMHPFGLRLPKPIADPKPSAD